MVTIYMEFEKLYFDQTVYGYKKLDVFYHFVI